MFNVYNIGENISVQNRKIWPAKQPVNTMNRQIPVKDKFEIQISKYETNLNNRNSNDKNYKKNSFYQYGVVLKIRSL